MTSLVACGGTDAPDPEPGVSQVLARHRAETLSHVRYELSLELPAELSQPIAGHVTIRFNRREGAGPLVLDFAPGMDVAVTVRVNGRDAAHRLVNGHLVMPDRGLREGENVVSIAFAAGDASLNRTPEYLYSLFVPARAHLAFPCFDQPDLKARFRLTLTIPAAWQALANGAEVSRATAGDRARLEFAETEPIPTYLFAFAAGAFSVETAERGGRTFRMLHRETDAAKVARNRDRVFDLHATALAWLEEYTARPYPFGKFDFLIVPSFQFGGMEHPGAIFYNAAGLLLDESATQSQQLGRASLVAHETSHMWFGDLVTMRWFDDVWMKEVFANFMAAKIVNPSFPEVNHDLRFLTAHYPAAYGVDRTAGTHPIRQPLGNLNDAGSLYGAIIYQKAPIVMRQLERLLGAETLRDGLRDYLERFAFGNATWLDLIALLDARTGRDLASWSRAWVEEGGRPRLIVETGTEGRPPAIRQEDPQTDRGLRWTQQIEVMVGTRPSPHTWSVILDEDRVAVPAATSAPVDFVLPTGGGLAYGEVVLDDRSRSYLLANVAELADPLTRGAVWVTLWEETIAGRVAPAAFVDAAAASLALEDVEQIVQLLTGYLSDAFWRVLSAPERAARAEGLERTLRAGLTRASTTSLKSTYFSALRRMTTTPAGTGFLERIWRRTERVQGLVLAEPDETGLALDLAVRGPSGAAAVLEEQRARIQNPDRKARFEFVMPALADDPAVRAAFFASLADPANRRREAWVIEAVTYLNHPLRAASAEAHLRAALDLVVDIQRTGDIFFPRNWLEATLGGHASPDAARIVRDFLSGRSDLPLHLRRLILQSADVLLRFHGGPQGA